ncbi:putative membrane protein [Varunaivibrio sulfuroxidans]|uniref:Protoporphyrinogen IX oxidase n=2 Tax=Varunaivibrio sulfuroxidans TaxID=1773489 RepID=A0A4R3JG48_9PROT|nr:protoporphyrinogen oxidase HemJ [Varunaivibrio sulfuroxidans]TCS64862.1 putative membrane protein [Varunaivibrio sulfuroxidans]
MFQISGEAYLWIKALHVISVIAWMAGLFYLPRLYVYHTQVLAGSESSELFKIMERRLLRAIMNPALVLSYVFGGLLLAQRVSFSDGWLHLKLLCVALLTVFHMALSKWRKDFLNDKNTKSEVFYRAVNEVPTILMIVIVVMVVVKPF